MNKKICFLTIRQYGIVKCPLQITALGLLFQLATITAGCSFSPGSSSQAKHHQLKTIKNANIAFDYNTSMFSEIKLTKIPKLTAQDVGEGIDEGMAPGHSCFRLKDKRPLPALEHGARYFFPAMSFICAIPLTDSSVDDFGNAYPSLVGAMSELQKLLRERPVKIAKRRELPDIPFNNAGHSILSRFQYLDFKSGSGILYLTQYSQEILPNPVNNEELTLVFQGITLDEKFYISARLAATHPDLPKGIDFTDHIERDRQYSYLRKTEKELGAFPEHAFQPSLENLKAMLSSIYVD